MHRITLLLSSSGNIIGNVHRGDIVKVRNLCDSFGNAVKLVIGGTTLTVRIGEEVVVGFDRHNLDTELKQDNFGRRKITKCTTEGGMHLIRSEISIIGLIQKHELLYSIYAKGLPCDRAIMDRVLKAAAALLQVTGKRGAYSAYAGRDTYVSAELNSPKL